ncbi:BLUF domain protein [Hymenobacter roseosalivarius DSM 11622]|uniref:BLUF domain protein n=1 Tax=Hymenobacter roseosalivarius DSM 11622 TaxID=645990 RepID=A0A1W1UQW6_9BACT|nr:BLUF domain-containing protein [Hymenobacter roseosalivarius]SMB83487.1 BLUF domain protein [Hymenobacter roseosalivarius DSM 11622]
MFYQLIYVSRAVAPLGAEAMQSLVTHARSNNALHHVTGALFYDGEHFAQILEGAQQEVESLFTRIQADNRHRQVTVVTRSQRARREYPHWGMAGHLLAAAQFAELVKCLPDEAEEPASRSLRVRLDPFVAQSKRL